MSPQSIDQTLQQGLAHHQAGRLDEAEALYRRALASDSDHPLALNLLGVLTRATQGDAAAEPLLRRAAALQASEAQYACDLARLLHSQKRFDEAIAEYRRAVSLDPEWADAQFG